MNFIKKILLIIIVSCLVTSCKTSKKETVKSTPKYTADWESLKQHETPEWFLDAKFGIYNATFAIHAIVIL